MGRRIHDPGPPGQVWSEAVASRAERGQPQLLHMSPCIRGGTPSAHRPSISGTTLPTGGQRGTVHPAGEAPQAGAASARGTPPKANPHGDTPPRS
eukprot:1512098-Rhodomonas_salina.1